MRLIVAILGLLIAPATLSAQSEPPAAAVAPGILSTGGATIICRMGVLTTVTLLTDKPISAMKGGPEIDCRLDGNLLRIQPRVPEGYTNIHLTIDGVVYPLIVQISVDELSATNPVFTIAGAADPFDSIVRAARPMRPSLIDVSGLISTCERAIVDEAFRRNLRYFRWIPLPNAWVWNSCTIRLREVFQFADQDMLVFRVQWRNATNNALYLHANQVRLFIGDKEVPVAIRSQNSPTPVIYPGQVETVWLFVQGMKLRPEQNWSLRLPPESAQIQPMVRAAK